MYDVVIVGGGPVGLAAAIEAKRCGLEYVLIEKGCVANAIFHYPTQMTFFTTSELLEIGRHPLVTQREKPDRKEALDYYRMVAQREDLNIRMYHEVKDIAATPDGFSVEVQGQHLEHWHTRRVLVATGYYDHPNHLGVPGENGPNVSAYYTEAHPFWERRVTIVGAGNSAADAALDLYRHGAKVTLVVRSSSLKPTLKYWIKPDLENRIREGHIRAFFETQVTEIQEGCVVAQRHGETLEIPTDFTFTLIGYRPKLDFLSRCNLPLGKEGQLELQDTFETCVPGLYVCGSAGFGTKTNQVFIENGREHAVIAVRDIARRLNPTSAPAST